MLARGTVGQGAQAMGHQITGGGSTARKVIGVFPAFVRGLSVKPHPHQQQKRHFQHTQRDRRQRQDSGLKGQRKVELLGQKSGGGQGQALLKEGQGKEKKQGVDEECDGGRVFGRGACIFVVGHRRRPWGPSGGGGWGRASFRGGASSHGSVDQAILKFYENLAPYQEPQPV